MFNSNSLPIKSECYLKILNTLNKHVNFYFNPSTNSTSNIKSKAFHGLQTNKNNLIDMSQYEVQKISPFIKRLITSDSQN